MSNFIKIVRNYEHVCHLGHKIINHKDFVRRAHPSVLDKEFKKQEERIQELVRAINKANSEWEKHPCANNTYWSGLS